MRDNEKVLWIELCSSSNPYVEALLSNVTVFGHGAFGRSLDLDEVI